MARPGFSQHRKFRRLVRSLGSQALARGALELIWDAAYENGEDYIGDTTDVEHAGDWQGEPGVLVAALLGAGGEGNAGFIDPDPDRPGHFRVHDLYDHAPEYVKKRMDREAARREQGVTLSQVRAAAAKAKHLKRLAEQGAQLAAEGAALAAERHATGGHPAASERHLQTNGSNWPANGTTPAPAPAPAPALAPPNNLRPEPTDDPIVATFPCVGKGPKHYDVRQKQIVTWQKAFPAVDVVGELRRARVWIESNPNNRKTANGCSAFITRWLGKRQDRSGQIPTTNGGNGVQVRGGNRAEGDRKAIEQMQARKTRQ
jgi:hypothetical protein